MDVHEKMKYGITILFLCLAGCAGRTHLPRPATHWTRSDDFGEYHGLYVFSQTPDGKLYGPQIKWYRNGTLFGVTVFEENAVKYMKEYGPDAVINK